MKNSVSNILIVSLLISYIVFLTTNGIGNFKYDNKQLNFMENKYEEIESRYNYLINNIKTGDVEENNREILYLEELKEEILDNLENEGEFWLIDLKNIINQKEETLIKNFMDEENNYKINDNYIKLKNEIDEYNMYYNFKRKPVEYSESLLLKYFTSIFNSRVHQVFLTCIVLFISILIINSGKYGYKGFLKISAVNVISIISIQLLSLFTLLMVDGVDNIFYPIRVVTEFKKDFSFGNNILDKAVPFYQIIVYTLAIESIYILFLVGVVKMMDLLFHVKWIKVISSFVLLIGIGAVSFTKYSGISFLSYGKFFDFVRGYETLYKEHQFLNMKYFIIFFMLNMIILGSTYLYKKYILNDKFLFG